VTGLVDRFFTGAGRLVVARPRQVLLLMALLFLASLAMLGNITMESGASTYLRADDPSLIAYNSFTKDFAQEDTIILFISTPDPLDTDFLHSLMIFEQELNRVPGVESTLTIADLLAEANGGTLPTSSSQTEQVLARLPKETVDKLVPDPLHTLGTVTTKGDATSLLAPVNTLINQAAFPPGVTIQASGNSAFNQEFQNEMTTQMGILIGAAFVLMFVALFFLFASVRYRFLPLLFVMLGLTYSFGFLGATRIPINIGAIGAFPVLLGLGIDYAVQFHSRLDDEMRKSGIEEAVMTTVRNTGPAVLNAMVATTVGFAVLFITPIPILGGFAITAITGIVCSYLATLFGFPAIAILMHYTPKEKKAGSGFGFHDGYNKVLSRSAGIIARNPIIILVIALVIAGAGMSIDGNIPIDTSENSLVPPDMPAKVVLDQVNILLGSQTPADMLVTGPDLTSVESVTWIDQYDIYIQEVFRNEITGVTSIATLVKEYNGGKIPDSDARMSEVLASIPPATLSQYLYDTSTGRITFQTTTLSAEQMSDMRNVMLESVPWLAPPPGVTARTAGQFELNAVTLDYIKTYKPEMTTLAFIMIFIFLLVVYRHFVSIGPLVPIICVVGWNSVVMTAFSIDYTFITASLGAITIGVSSEYTILMMERYLEERKGSSDRIDAIRTGVQKIGAAVTVSGLVTVFGFAALMLSSFPIISNFGLMTVIAVLFSLIGAIAIMPAILSVLIRVEKVFER
jgi:hydrophobe/amphiphile efflux-3 (HAE3) family protein